jgi:hypothetical protein
MFMVVGFPWPVPSAHVELTGYQQPKEIPARADTRSGDQARPELVGAGRVR